MDWSATTFDWNQTRAFLVTAEEGSLTAAARALGLAQSTLSRQVDSLESRLGVALFERIGRRLELTPSGRVLLPHARAMGESAVRLSLAASGQAASLRGQVSISASEVVAAYLLPPVIATLRADHPGIDIDVVSSNAASDLQRREADIAIRSYRPTEPELIARKLGDAPARLFASDRYLERLGPVRGPADLRHATFIGFDRTEQLVSALNALGLELTAARFPVVSASHLVQWQLVKEGLGIGIMPEDIGRAEPGVREVLPTLPPIPTARWLVAHRELQTSRRIRVVFDGLVAGLGQSVQQPRSS